MKIFRFLPILFLGWAPFLAADIGPVLAQMGTASRSKLPEDRPIKILVWNIYKTKMPSFYHDFEKLMADKDIAIIQEAFLDDFFVRMMNLNRKFQATVAKSFLVNGLIPTGVMTLSQTAPLRSSYRASPTTEPFINTHKMTLLQTYQVGQSHLLIANIHAINFVTTESFEKQIQDLYETIRLHRGPIIFAGDFNTWSEERTNVLNHYINLLGLRPVSFIPDQRKRFFDLPLDHIFVSREISVLDSKTWPFIKGSDHIALEATIKIQSL